MQSIFVSYDENDERLLLIGHKGMIMTVREHHHLQYQMVCYQWVGYEMVDE